ncbi:uncharacterized protein [Rutidosis leptorrhynchoides]|uniref:uncharacterized protein n=1 Tax=Rutidosis leptorrhynchoides TaxID=125765 RepID=UPI003A993248
MNLYYIDEVNSQNFITGLTGWPSGVEPRDFWTTFGAGDYQTYLSSTSITQPSYKILHRAIFETINQRATCTYNVTRSDMLYMYYIVHNTLCNLARCLARYLYKSVRKKHNAAICGGAYITQLALGLGDNTESDLLALTEVATTTYFDEAHLANLDLVDNKNHSGGNVSAAREERTAVNSEAFQDPRFSDLEKDLHYTNEAVRFLFKELGYSFAPCPSSSRQSGKAASSSHPKFTKSTVARFRARLP